jgi:hypothetical protein
MPYSTEELEEIFEALATWNERLEKLVTAVLIREYKNIRSKEYAIHGFSRRLHTLQHCLDRTFSCVPPQAESPTRSELQDATAFIQAFVLNVYGAIDNLAHIWCFEAGVKDKIGRELDPKFIGLTPKNKIIRSSLPSPFKEKMNERDTWFKYLINYRHALAHRIPLYIIPRILNNEDGKQYENIEKLKFAAATARDWITYNDLDAKQDRVGTFAPYILHSLEEDAAPMRFHPQMVCDMATVVEIGEELLFELDKLRVVFSTD